MNSFKNSSKKQLIEEINKLKKQISNQSSESDSRLHALFNAMTDVVFEMDYDGRYLNVAPTSPRLIYDHGATGKTLHEVFPKDKADVFLAFIRDCLNSNKAITTQYSLEIDNEILWFEGTATPKTKNNVLFIARDITQSKKASEELVKSYETIERERNMFIKGNVVVFKWKNAEGWPVEYVSPNVIEVLGYSQSELYSGVIPYTSTILHDDFAQVCNEIDLYGNSGALRFSHAPYRIIKKDGTIIWVDDNTTIIRNEDGEITHYQGYLVDITLRKKAEDKLRVALEQSEKSKKRLKESQEIALLGNWDLDIPNNKLSWSDEVFRILELNPEKFTVSYEGFVNMIHPEDRSMVNGAYLNSLITKEPYEIKYRVLLADGRIKYVIEKCRTEFDDSGEPILSAGIIQDLTVQEEANIALEASESKFRELFERSGDAILIIKNGIFVDCNNAAIELLNYGDKNEFLNVHPSKLSPKMQPNGRNSIIMADEMIATSLKNGTHRFEWYHTKSNGDIFPVEVLLTAITNVPGNQVIHVVWRDITERVKKDKKIKAAKEYLEQLTNSMWAVVFSVKIPERVIEWANDSYNILGYTNEEYIGRNTSFLYANKTDYKKFGGKVEAAIADGKDVFHAYQLLKKKNGETIPAEVTFTFHKENKKITHITSIIRDISNRVQLESDLISANAKAEQEEQKFKAIINQAIDGITVADMEGNYLIVNPAFCTMSGYSEDELLKLTVFDMKAENQPHSSFSDSKGKMEGIPIRVNLQKKDGTQYQTEIIGAIIELNNQKLVLGTVRDIGERVKAEKALEESELLLRESQQAAQIGSYVMDAVTGDWRGSLTLNDVFGINEEFPTNVKSWLSVVHPDDREMMQNYFEVNVLTNHEQFNKEYRIIRHNDKKIRWLHGVGRLGFNEDGNPITITGVVQDITEKKLADIELEKLNSSLETQNEEYQILNDELGDTLKQIKVINKQLELSKEQAEESDRLKSAFLANMSHEIRTPMNGILGFADLLKTPNLTGDELVNYTSVIEKSGKRMLNIINDLIDISKIEAGQMEVYTSECFINKQIEYLEVFFTPEAFKKGIQISINNAVFDTEFSINTDREKLYAILTNLIKNSIKYTHTGNIEIGYKMNENDGNNELEFFVKDTGIGIPKDRQNAIFERFIQADIEDKQVYEGAGLGLAITKSYVEMLGGKIWVESKEGNLSANKAGGSTFYFTIPYTNNDTTNAQALVEVDNKNGFGNLNDTIEILIAEDDGTTDTYLTIILDNISSKLHHASNGVQAVDICRSNPAIDLILLDIRMPLLNGYEAAKQIRKFNKDVIIVAQTAYALEGDRQKAISAGCNDYISKPIDKDELISIIERQLKLSI